MIKESRKVLPSKRMPETLPECHVGGLTPFRFGKQVQTRKLRPSWDA